MHVFSCHYEAAFPLKQPLRRIHTHTEVGKGWMWICAFKQKDSDPLFVFVCGVHTYPRQTQSPCSERCACSLRPDRAAPERPPSCLLWTRAPPPSSLPRHCQSPPRPERAGCGPRGSLRTSITSWVQPRGAGGRGSCGSQVGSLSVFLSQYIHILLIMDWIYIALFKAGKLHV